MPNDYPVTTAADTGAGSLRDAINQANAHDGPDTISFNLNTADLLYNAADQYWTITLQSDLPAITGPLSIDGRTQSPYGSLLRPVIAVVGGVVPGVPGGRTKGFDFKDNAAGSTIYGLSISSCEFGITIQVDGVTVQDCYVGLWPTGLPAGGNAEYGIGISSNNNVIGSSDGSPGGNLIGRNPKAGIRLAGTASGNKIARNVIGLGVNGVSAPNGTVGNALTGGIVLEEGTSKNVIGGPTSSYRNVISDNNASGILMVSSTDNQVMNNYIGTLADGTTAAPNETYGVEIQGLSARNTIGTYAPPGEAAIPGKNVINGFAAGVYIEGAKDNSVFGNWIGLGADGTTALPSTGYGVKVVDSQGNRIGGDRSLGYGNMIVKQTSGGVSIEGENSTVNLVRGNYIGTTAGKADNLGNGVGVQVLNGSKNTIGGTAASFGNIICRNGTGIRISGTAAEANLIVGNRVGVTHDSAGMADAIQLGNDTGIIIDQAVGTLIGAPGDTMRNVISGNGQKVRPTDETVWHGISVKAGSKGTQIRNNFIGLAPDGLTSMGNGQSGVFIQAAATGTVVGGEATARNYISANNAYGVEIRGSATVVSFNTMGRNTAGNATDGNGASLNNVKAAFAVSKALQDPMLAPELKPVFVNNDGQASTVTVD